MLEIQEQDKQTQPASRLVQRTGRLLLWAALLLVFLKTTGVLSTPAMPGFEPDPSWPYGLNQAAAQGLTFGKDIVFTFGPYASVFTRCYHPATVWRMVLGALLLDLLYVGCFASLVKCAGWRWPLLLSCIVLLPTADKDAFFFSIPLLVSLTVLKLQLMRDGEALEKTSTKVLVVLAFACLGLLPLIKGTVLLLTAGMCTACALFLLVNRQRLLAILCLAAPGISLALLWVAVGQPLSGLAGYFGNMRFIISGYSEAMAADGPLWATIVFLAGAAALLLAIAVKKSLQIDQKTLLLFLYSFFFFIAFKEGSIRQDLGHIRIAMSGLLFASLFLALLNVEGGLSFDAGKLLTVAMLPTLLIGIPWYASVANQPGGAPSLTAAVFHLDPWGMDVRGWQRDFEAGQRTINAASGLNFAMSGTVDMYATNDLDSLLCKGYRWDPRPVIISYPAYTPQLIQLNEQHLRVAAAPDDLVIRLEPMDGHPPALEDGLSWPAMLDNYTVTGEADNWVRLSRKASLRTASRYVALGTMRAKLGEQVPVPAARGPLFVEIDEMPTPWGKVLEMLYKPPALSLKVTTKSGATITYRAVAGMMQTGFILSPLVRDNAGFVRLFDPKATANAGDEVRSIVLDVFHGSRSGWSREYSIRFQQYVY